jgi:hypothetical protein
MRCMRRDGIRCSSEKVGMTRIPSAYLLGTDNLESGKRGTATSRKKRSWLIFIIFVERSSTIEHTRHPPPTEAELIYI